MSYAVMCNEKVVAFRHTQQDAENLVNKYHEYEDQFAELKYPCPEYEIIKVESVKGTGSIKERFYGSLGTIYCSCKKNIHNMLW